MPFIHPITVCLGLEEQLAGEVTHQIQHMLQYLNTTGLVKDKNGDLNSNPI